MQPAVKTTREPKEANAQGCIKKQVTDGNKERNQLHHEEIDASTHERPNCVDDEIEN